jgi:hypothetical protein
MSERVRHPLLKSAVACGSGASVLSAMVLAICSKLEERSFAGGLNGPSQWLWGGRKARSRETSLKHTVVGYLIHHASSIFWAALYSKVCGSARRKSAARVLAEAAAVSATAYVVDYKLTPKRLEPGFDKHIRPTSIVAVYAGFAVGLAVMTWMRRNAGQPEALMNCRLR